MKGHKENNAIKKSDVHMKFLHKALLFKNIDDVFEVWILRSFKSDIKVISVKQRGQPSEL